MRKTQLFLFIIAVCAVTAGIIWFLTMRGRDNTAVTRQCDTAILALLKHNGIDDTMLRGTKRRRLYSGKNRLEYIEREFLVPSAINLPRLQKSISEGKDVEPLAIGKIQKSRDKKEQALTIELCLEKLTLYRLTLRQKISVEKTTGEIPGKPVEKKAGLIAVVLDDWGYSSDLLDEAQAIGIPITYAILPNLPYSQEIADNLQNAGQEYILHLPMEPHNAGAQSLEKNTLRTAMPDAEVLQIIRQDIGMLPAIRGVNNHMGSLATEDERLMRLLMNELKQRNLYFLDSYTSNTSAAGKIARELHIPFLRRDIFLDNTETRESIGRQMDKAKTMALENGRVIAIGHAREVTLETLKDLIPQLKNEGFTFVFLSQLKTGE